MFERFNLLLFPKVEMFQLYYQFFFERNVKRANVNDSLCLGSNIRAPVVTMYA